MVAEWVGGPSAGRRGLRHAIETVLDVYQYPSDAAFPVVCMGETPRQLIHEVHVPIPERPRQPAHRACEYARCGIYYVFMAAEPLTDKRQTAPSSATGFFVKCGRKLCQMRWNLHSALHEAFPPAQAMALRDRFEFVYTPRHGSWLKGGNVKSYVSGRRGC